MSYVRGNPYATRGQSQADARRLAWEKQQEDNLYYVACTRALDKLVFVK